MRGVSPQASGAARSMDTTKKVDRRGLSWSQERGSELHFVADADETVESRLGA